MELNPNHPMTAKLRDNDLWYKLAAILVNREPEHKTLITMAEAQRIAGTAIVVKETPAGIELAVVSMVEAERLAKKEGGLPV